MLRNKIVHLHAFCHTYEHGSFSSAAKKLGVSPQAVSRSVARLETSLGVVLFRRNTRHLEPTAAAHAYYDAARQALDTLTEAESLLSQSLKTCEGEVRISVPTTFGHHRFMAMVGPFQDAYPDVTLDIQISNQNIDFVQQGFDVAVRMGPLQDASFVARRLGDYTLGVFAHPDYLERFGEPTSLDELLHHRCAAFMMPSSGRVLPWSFDHPEITLNPPSTVSIREDVLGLISYARGGGGLIQIYHFLVEADLERGDLVEILRGRAGRRRPFSLIYPKSAVARPQVRALVDFIVDRTKCDRDAK